MTLSTREINEAIAEYVTGTLGYTTEPGAYQGRRLSDISTIYLSKKRVQILLVITEGEAEITCTNCRGDWVERKIDLGHPNSLETVCQVLALADDPLFYKRNPNV